MFHNYANSATNTGDYPANVPQIGQNARADCDALATKLALEVPRTSNLSEFPLRVAFAHYVLSVKAGRSAACVSEDVRNEALVQQPICARVSASLLWPFCGTFSGDCSDGFFTQL